jgi:biopolymer transport protein TolR
VTIPVDLPKTQGVKSSEEKDPLVVSLNEKGKIYIQDTEIDEGQLTAKLEALTHNNKELKVFVRGDKRVPYGDIMMIMGKISKAGFSKVALMAELDQ